MRKEQHQSCALTLCLGHRHELDLRDRTRRRRQPWYLCGHGGRGDDPGYTLPDSEAVASSWGCRCHRPRHSIRHHHSLVRACRSSAQWRLGLVQISPWEDESLVGDSRSVRLHRLPLRASCIWPVPGAERVQQKRNVAGGYLRGVVRRRGFSGHVVPLLRVPYSLPKQAIATDDAHRASYIAAANYASAMLNSPLEIVYAIVTLSSGILLIGLVMLRGAFNKIKAYLALGTGVLGILSLTGSSFAIIGNALFATAWHFFVGYRLYRLAQE